MTSITEGGRTRGPYNIGLNYEVASAERNVHKHYHRTQGLSYFILGLTSIEMKYKVTLGILQQAKELDIPALWLQPGAEDSTVIAYINEHGLADRVIYGGPCILVEGDDIVRSLL